MTNPADAHAELARSKYVSFTTFRKNGDPVATPVWIAPLGSDLVFVSVDNVGKTKRLARDREVVLSPCDFRGSVAPGAPAYAGTAVVERDPAALDSARRAIAAKYLLARIGNAFQALLARLGRGKPRAAIRITLAEPSSGS